LELDHWRVTLIENWSVDGSYSLLFALSKRKGQIYRMKEIKGVRVVSSLERKKSKRP
jgi:hypothetical protein